MFKSFWQISESKNISDKIKKLEFDFFLHIRVWSFGKKMFSRYPVFLNRRKIALNRNFPVLVIKKLKARDFNFLLKDRTTFFLKGRSNQISKSLT